MPSMDFDAALAAEEREPVTFRVAGSEFRCVAIDELPWTAGMRLAAAPDTGPEATDAIYQWFDAVIVAEDLAKWHALRDTIGQGTFVRLIEWLGEVYTGRPTTRPSDSAGGSAITGPPSRAAWSWPADNAELRIVPGAQAG